MTRGITAEVGETRISQNGYQYTKTPQEWRLTHQIIAEEMLGRPLQDDERVRFKDTNRRNLSPSNILIVKKKRNSSVEKRRAYLTAKIADLQAQLEELE